MIPSRSDRTSLHESGGPIGRPEGIRSTMKIFETGWRPLAVTVAGIALVAASAISGSAAAAGHQPGKHPQNPYDPATGHPYRHGAVPTQELNGKMKAWQHANIAATGPKTLS